jgi:hypothetical protein
MTMSGYKVILQQDHLRFFRKRSKGTVVTYRAKHGKEAVDPCRSR